MHVHISAIAAAFGLAAVFATAAAQAEKPEAVFDEASQAWATAYNAGDADTIIAMYADDAVLMPPDAPAASGHDAMRAFLARDMAASRDAGITLALDEGGSAGSSGDLGWHAGTYSANAADGHSVGTGKYLEVWQRQAGKWVMIRDTWNSDAPAQAAAATDD